MVIPTTVTSLLLLSSLATAEVADPGFDPPITRAESLQAAAEATLQAGGSLQRAARMLEESAALRPASDPAAYTAYLQAASLRAVAGDCRKAMHGYDNAAANAMGRGAVLHAAHALISAAHAAACSGSPDLARERAERALLLAHSPHLPEPYAEHIRRRATLN